MSVDAPSPLTPADRERQAMVDALSRFVSDPVKVAAEVDILENAGFTSELLHDYLDEWGASGDIDARSLERMDSRGVTPALAGFFLSKGVLAANGAIRGWTAALIQFPPDWPRPLIASLVAAGVPSSAGVGEDFLQWVAAAPQHDPYQVLLAYQGATAAVPGVIIPPRPRDITQDLTREALAFVLAGQPDTVRQASLVWAMLDTLPQFASDPEFTKAPSLGSDPVLVARRAWLVDHADWDAGDPVPASAAVSGEDLLTFSADPAAIAWLDALNDSSLPRDHSTQYLMVCAHYAASQSPAPAYAPFVSDTHESRVAAARLLSDQGPVLAASTLGIVLGHFPYTALEQVMAAVESAGLDMARVLTSPRAAFVNLPAVLPLVRLTFPAATAEQLETLVAGNATAAEVMARVLVLGARRPDLAPSAVELLSKSTLASSLALDWHPGSTVDGSPSPYQEVLTLEDLLALADRRYPSSSQGGVPSSPHEVEIEAMYRSWAPPANPVGLLDPSTVVPHGLLASARVVAEHFPALSPAARSWVAAARSATQVNALAGLMAAHDLVHDGLAESLLIYNPRCPSLENSISAWSELLGVSGPALAAAVQGYFPQNVLWKDREPGSREPLRLGLLAEPTDVAAWRSEFPDASLAQLCYLHYQRSGRASIDVRDLKEIFPGLSADLAVTLVSTYTDNFTGTAWRLSPLKVSHEWLVEWLTELKRNNPTVTAPMALAALLRLASIEPGTLEYFNTSAQMGWNDRRKVKSFTSQAEKAVQDSHEVVGHWLESKGVDLSAAPVELLGPLGSATSPRVISMPGRSTPTAPVVDATELDAALARVQVLQERYGEYATDFDTLFTMPALLSSDFPPLSDFLVVLVRFEDAARGAQSGRLSSLQAVELADAAQVAFDRLVSEALKANFLYVKGSATGQAILDMLPKATLFANRAEDESSAPVERAKAEIELAKLMDSMTQSLGGPAALAGRRELVASLPAPAPQVSPAPSRSM